MLGGIFITPVIINSSWVIRMPVTDVFVPVSRVQKFKNAFKHNSVRKLVCKKLHPYLTQIYLSWILLSLVCWFDVSISPLPKMIFFKVVTWWISLRSRSFSIWMSRMILCESSAGWSTVVFSKFSVIDERNGVSCGFKNTSHVESHVGKSAFVVAFSVAFWWPSLDVFLSAPSVLLGIFSSSEIQKVLLLVLKSF